MSKFRFSSCHHEKSKTFSGRYHFEMAFNPLCCQEIGLQYAQIIAHSLFQALILHNWNAGSACSFPSMDTLSWTLLCLLPSVLFFCHLWSPVFFRLQPVMNLPQLASSQFPGCLDVSYLHLPHFLYGSTFPWQNLPACSVPSSCYDMLWYVMIMLYIQLWHQQYVLLRTRMKSKYWVSVSEKGGFCSSVIWPCLYLPVSQEIQVERCSAAAGNHLPCVR